MTTVINNPGHDDGADSFMGIILGLILLLVIVGVFIIYALPTIRGNRATPQSGTIDVNVKMPDVIAPAPSPAPASPGY